jgi:hypothetical protein
MVTVLRFLNQIRNTAGNSRLNCINHLVNINFYKKEILSL